MVLFHIESCCPKRSESPPLGFYKRRYVRVIQIETGYGILQMSGDEKSKIKDADNSTASFMLLALQECKKLIICEKDLKRKTSSIQKGNEVEHYLQYAFLW